MPAPLLVNTCPAVPGAISAIVVTPLATGIDPTVQMFFPVPPLPTPIVPAIAAAGRLVQVLLAHEIVAPTIVLLHVAVVPPSIMIRLALPPAIEPGPIVPLVMFAPLIVGAVGACALSSVPMHVFSLPAADRHIGLYV